MVKCAQTIYMSLCTYILQHVIMTQPLTIPWTPWACSCINPHLKPIRNMKSLGHVSHKARWCEFCLILIWHSLALFLALEIHFSKRSNIGEMVVASLLFKQLIQVRLVCNGGAHKEQCRMSLSVCSLHWRTFSLSNWSKWCLYVVDEPIKNNVGWGYQFAASIGAP